MMEKLITTKMSSRHPENVNYVYYETGISGTKSRTNTAGSQHGAGCLRDAP